jgi:hypothetical protein
MKANGALVCVTVIESHESRRGDGTVSMKIRAYVFRVLKIRPWLIRQYTHSRTRHLNNAR